MEHNVRRFKNSERLGNVNTCDPTKNCNLIIEYKNDPKVQMSVICLMSIVRRNCSAFEWKYEF